jgi:hypothetical protein
MDAFYLYLELVALAILIWLCYDKLKPVVARPLVRESGDMPGVASPVVRRRFRMLRAPLRSRRLRRNRSSSAR